MTAPSIPEGPARRGLVDLLGALRAESLGDQVFDYFAEPSFFPKLASRQSCLLKGGRGTGKTTLLRCMSYQGQRALRPTEDIRDWEYFGVFTKFHTSKVAAFEGPELPRQRWVKLFGHYVNIELTELLLDLIEWMGAEHSDWTLEPATWHEVAVSLNLPIVDSVLELRRQLRLHRMTFEARLNNIVDVDESLGLSMLPAPIDLLVQHLRRQPWFAGKKLFFLIDEYENLLDYQQEVINTLIKHSSASYAFKIGVKELGFRRHTTINPTEQLSTPADYDVIAIADELAPRFESYAAELVGQRIAAVMGPSLHGGRDVIRLFEALSPDTEAVRLGVDEINARFVSRLPIAARDVVGLLDALSPLQRFFVAAWSGATGEDVFEVAKGLVNRDKSWVRRYGNYSFALLFAIRAGKPGRQKLYSGWSTICRLANTNVRYLLDLVGGMLDQHLREGHSLEEPVSAECQTDWAQEVGRKYLQELERDTDEAASLVRLVLALGRVFEVLASTPVGHTPEITQFALPSGQEGGAEASDSERRIKDILDEGINSLALVRYPGSKLQRRFSIRSYDYSLHPLFTALFGFSYRRKRKMEISDEEFLGLIGEPRWAINRILIRQNRDPSSAPLPDQLRLFAGFYA